MNDARVNNTYVITYIVLFSIIFNFSYSQQLNYVIGGQVFAGTLPLDKGRAIIYENNGNNFVPYDTSYIDTLGYFLFLNIPQGDYIIKAEPLNNLTTINKYAPTYYGDFINWENAYLIIPSNNIFNADIHLISLQKNNGECGIKGKVIDNTGNIYPNASVLLLNENKIPINFALSSIDGTFEFNNISKGNYIIKAEVTGIPSTEVFVNLTDSNPLLSGIVLIINAYSEIKYNERDKNVIVNTFPNPFFDKFNIIFNDKVGRKGTVTIFFVNGNYIESYPIESNKKNEINLSNQHAGEYVILICYDELCVKKIVLKL
ncbi:MAG TPA: carboxypeptidase regulatory-like domain-containing protein [Bacteroidales bacterium]|nr:carboxypeptidase regulatory-like domain-containing protein [Bacteroidales bacterium]